MHGKNVLKQNVRRWHEIPKFVYKTYIKGIALTDTMQVSTGRLCSEKTLEPPSSDEIVCVTKWI